MILTVATESDLVVNINCEPYDTVASVKNSVANQIGIPAAQQQLFFQGRPLGNNQTIASIGMADGDLLMLEQQPVVEQRTRGGAGALGTLMGQQLVERATANPELLSRIEAENPQLAAAIRSNDSERAMALLIEAGELARQQEMEQIRSDPMGAEAQKKIWEQIQKTNIEENYQQALEHTPEMFGIVTMLYVNMEVNGVRVQAFVDTGAQMTIMSADFAEKCSLMRLIDKRYAGMAYGVGQSKLLGRVHQAQLKVGGEYMASSLSVIEQNTGPPFIFGLDNLVRHQCTVDLKAMKLVIGSVNAEVPFLAEHQIDQETSFKPQEDSNAATSSANGPPSESGDSVFEEKVQRLMALGFDRQRCANALKATHGNEDAAAALLFGAD